MSAIIVFDPAEFKVQYPQFTSVDDAVLQGYFDRGTCFISNLNYGWLRGYCRKQALYLMVAHLATLNDLIISGQAPAFVSGATIDKISVTLEAPPKPDQFIWWLNTTPYGSQLAALLTKYAAGGVYVGGLPERSAFRRVFGIRR